MPARYSLLLPICIFGCGGNLMRHFGAIYDFSEFPDFGPRCIFRHTRYDDGATDDLIWPLPF